MNSAIDLAKQGDSTIIILIIVVALVIVSLVPVMKTLASIDSAKRKREIDREGQLIGVVERNTEVNAALKTLIESDRKVCEECRNDQQNLFHKIFENQEIANMKLVAISTTLNINKEDKKTPKKEEEK